MWKITVNSDKRKAKNLKEEKVVRKEERKKGES